MRIVALTRVRWRQLSLLIIAPFLLTGCSPGFDWRVVRPDLAPFMIDLPAKPASLTRAINLDGLPVEMEMHGARVGNLNFTAAWARLPETPPDTPAQTQTEDPAEPSAALAVKALTAMQQGMVNNIDGNITEQREQNLPLVNSLGEQAGLIPGTFIDVVGSAGGKPVRMQAIFVSLNRILVQFVVLGTDWSDDAAAVFLESVRLRLPPGLTQ